MASIATARVLLNVGDEEGFISYVEKVVYEMQKLWRGMYLAFSGPNCSLLTCNTVLKNKQHS